MLIHNTLEEEAVIGVSKIEPGKSNNCYTYTNSYLQE